MSDTKKPELRFEGFNDDWEQRKLSCIVDCVTRKNTNLESTLPLTISAQYGLVDQVTYFNNRVASQNISNYYLVKNGEFAYNKSSSDGYPFGTVKRLDLYDMGVLSTLYIVFALKDQNVNSDFLACYYDTDNWYKQVSERAAEGARNHGLLNISADDFLDTDLMIPPDIQEQALIGEYLKKLDNLITLHQRKYEKLLVIKKSMLGKMFPKAGEKVPEIRFAGFTDDWEQRKLADVLSSYTDPVEIPHTGYERLGIRSHAKGTFHSYVPAGHELQTAQMHKVAADKFIVNITFGWEHAVAVTDENDAGKLVSHRFPQFSLSEELDPKFLKFIILDENFRHHLWLASPGGAGRNRVLNLTEMLQYEIYIPSVSEQRQIADVLIRLDNLITLHQREVNKLKNLKKSLLGKMFI